MTGNQAPFMEGFDNPTMNNIFGQLLQSTPYTHTTTRNPASPSSIPTETTGLGVQTAFLQQMLQDQRATADSLMDTAKKIGPIAQVASTSQDAYDAAFESDIVAPLPNKSATLQGFTLAFFYLSLFCLAIVSSIVVNQMTGSTSTAIKIFGGFLIAIVIATAAIIRFG